MILFSLILFAVAAFAGLAMAVLHFRGASPPKTVLAVAGFLTLLLSELALLT
jgi:hypothetical protein